MTRIAIITTALALSLPVFAHAQTLTSPNVCIGFAELNGALYAQNGLEYDSAGAIQCYIAPAYGHITAKSPNDHAYHLMCRIGDQGWNAMQATMPSLFDASGKLITPNDGCGPVPANAQTDAVPTPKE